MSAPHVNNLMEIMDWRLEQEHISLGLGPENVIEEVETFTYLGDIVDRDGGVERAVRGRVIVAWSKWREIAGLLCNRRIPLQKPFQHLRGMHQVCNALWLRNLAPHAVYGEIFSQL